MPGRRRMKHHWAITGVTQSGKSTLARVLLEATPRWVNLDQRGDYTDLGSIATSFSEASVMLRDRATDPELRVTLQADAHGHHLALVEYMKTLWTGRQIPPIVLVMDEAVDWSRIGNGRELPGELSWMYTAGLKYGIGTLTIMQRDQQVVAGARGMADYRVAFRHVGPLSDDMQTAFGDRADELAALETLTPGTDPLKGTHYLTYPHDMNVLKTWRKEVVNPMR